MKLSIIIPVYNVERYLEKCLNSCVFQNVDPSNYEVIIVNDGSEDRSAAILDTYDWKKCNHTIVVQKNQGLSMARNNGVKVAKGDYIWFVDSDDWISENSLKILLPILDGNYDVICQRSYYKSYINKEVLMNKSELYDSGVELLKHNYDVMTVLYIYKRTFFNGLGFAMEPNIYHEDTHFTPRALYLAKRICCINEPLYYYFQREGSIMSQHNPKKVYDQIKILKDLYAFCNDRVRIEDRKGWIGQLMSGPILNILWLSKQIDDPKLQVDVKHILNADIRYTKALIDSPFTSIKILGYLSFLCFGNLYSAYSILYNLRYKK